MVKTCTKCGVEKPTSYFYREGKRRPEHFRSECKDCTNSVNKSYISSHKEVARQCGRRWQQKNKDYMKEYRTKNKDRHKELHKKYREKNRDRLNASVRKWKSKNRKEYLAKSREWRKRTPDKQREYQRRWRRKNPGKSIALLRKRQTQQIKAMPKWANEFFISEIYHLAKLREKHTGGKWHVDHVIPLQHPLVCGLHVEHNLRVITSNMNTSKGNRHWPDMP